jgi:CBS domain containing-hemolysin-like protein
MSTRYQNLRHTLLSSGTTIYKSNETEAGSVTLKDSAEVAFTDFKRIRPFSISAAVSLQEVNDKMIKCGVRLLFVADSDGNLQGLITYTDLYGEKPVRYIREQGGTRDEILARDLMTPLIQLESLHHSDVVEANVGDIVETIKTAGRQHMLVNETLEDGSQVITGLISSTHLEKLLNMKIELSARANTFADLERALT